jgi:hypothetical protein
MRVMLHARCLRDVVSAGTPDYMEDRMALEVIAKAVPLEMLGSIASKLSTKAAWEDITLRNIGIDRACKAKASPLKREFDALTFNDGESVNEFSAHIERITNQLDVLGFEYTEEEVVRQFLLALPSKFKQITSSIETLLDLEMIMVDELIGHLKPSEESINHNSCNTVVAQFDPRRGHHRTTTSKGVVAGKAVDQAAVMQEVTEAAAKQVNVVARLLAAVVVALAAKS